MRNVFLVVVSAVWTLTTSIICNGTQLLCAKVFVCSTPVKVLPKWRSLCCERSFIQVWPMNWGLSSDFSSHQWCRFKQTDIPGLKSTSHAIQGTSPAQGVWEGVGSEKELLLVQRLIEADKVRVCYCFERGTSDCLHYHVGPHVYCVYRIRVPFRQWLPSEWLVKLRVCVKGATCPHQGLCPPTSLESRTDIFRLKH